MSSLHKTYTASPSSQPLNVSFSCTCELVVTINWVAPLDTPLCVHSYVYAVTFVNPVSSQVMVYNTTDNSTSLNITDLTLDGEFSVSVAGRDGAGRLGENSSYFSCKYIMIMFIVNEQQNFMAFTVWMNDECHHFLL